MTTLRGAIRTVDITPHDFPDIRLGGFGFNRRATGILHPLTSGVLYLTDGDEEIALVTVDSIGLMRPAVERIRAAVGRVSPDRVLVCSTHDHAAPDTMGYWGRALLWALPISSGIDERYMDQLVSTVARAVDDAAAAAEPVSLHATAFDVDPTLFTNHRKGGPKDDRGVVLRVDDAQGRPLGTLLNFAAHPEGLWEKNRRVSADYPHHVREAMRARGVGEPLFFSGALGGMLTPDIPIKASTHEREQAIDHIGTALGNAAAEAAKNAPPLPEGDRPERGVRVAKTLLDLPVRNWRLRLLHRLGVLQREDMSDHLRTEMVLVELAGLRLLTIPGEALPALGSELRAVLGGGLSMLLGLGGDEVGYILPKRAFEDREYRYEVTMSLGPDTAPRVVETAQKLTAALSEEGRGVA